MKYSNIYPYQNRSLNGAQLLMEGGDLRSPKRLALIALMNLDVGECFLHETWGDVSVVSVDEGQLTIATQEGVEVFKNAPLTLDFDDLCETLGEMYFTPLIDELNGDEKSNKTYQQSSLSLVLERDPAVFRGMFGGWIINDELCKYSGNITYDKSEQSVNSLVDETVKQDSSNMNKTEVHLESSEQDDEQMSLF
jgi:hypothetical protein